MDGYATSSIAFPKWVSLLTFRTDYPVANTSDALANTRLLAVGFGAKYFLYFELEDKVLMSIQNGERVECGVITPRGLKPPSGKESGDVIFGPGSWPDFNCLIM